MSEFPDQNKIHESDEDRERQRTILKMFAIHFNLTGKLTKALDRQDARLFRDDKYIALAEAKYRNVGVDEYPDYTVDVEKVDSLVQRAKADGVRGVLIVSWQGDVRYLNVTKAFSGWEPNDHEHVFSVGTQLRRDRLELPDHVYHIPYDRFTRLK